jgi:hypothetical protein
MDATVGHKCVGPCDSAIVQLVARSVPHGKTGGAALRQRAAMGAVRPRQVFCRIVGALFFE